MSTAHGEAILMGALAAFWLVVSALSFRLQRRSGYRSQWRYIALALAAIGLVLMALNLNGYVFSGMGASQPSHGTTTHG